jgi:hypothetical protein
MPLDIGVGILLSIGIAEYFSLPLTPFLLALGIFAALLPDIDIASLLWGRWRHRVATHFPLTYVPIAALVFLIAGPSYGTLFSLGVLSHFIHDTIGIGWGIAWGWPFSRRKFLLYPGSRREPIMGRFASWLPEEQSAIEAEIEERYPYRGSGSWVVDYYLRPSLVAFIEYGALAAALATLTWYTQG